MLYIRYVVSDCAEGACDRRAGLVATVLWGRAPSHRFAAQIRDDSTHGTVTVAVANGRLGTTGGSLLGQSRRRLRLGAGARPRSCAREATRDQGEGAKTSYWL